MKKLIASWMALALALVVVPVFAGDDKADDLKKLTEATTTIKEILSIPENGIPQEMLDNAAAVVVIPDMVKAAFIVGGKGGDGVMSLHGGTGWSNPAFVEAGGGSVGLQAGIEEADLVLVFMSEKHVNKLLNGEFTLGADASVAAGPVGRQGSIGTNENAKSAIYAYSRSQGVFAGVSLDGTKFDVDEEANVRVYGTGANVHNIVHGKQATKAPAEAETFKTTLNSLTKAENVKAKM
ncbi:MAG TPA: lipid-binding SYLF domain-containing protein [Candidatus Krumholzibacteria bacterium]|nr:lipid-binding SYLF domain-containing protein [Candidatus Krumholzibacteria bacterium]